MNASSTTAAALERHGPFKGPVILPGDRDYETARAVQHGGIDRRPAAIVRVADADDVSRVVSLARESGFELAVRSGGHSGAGHGVSEGGVVLDLAAMRALEIDPGARTAWAETGLRTGEYTAAAGAHGLATGFGDSGSVGIGGITLGGGVGFLTRKHGMTIDDLLAAEIVTADGEQLYTDAETHPDLFWAIRGGGGNFGVATRLKLRLHELDPFVGGLLLLPATPEVIASFVAAAAAAPEELTTIANVMPAPPLPFVPASQHGRLVVMGMLAFAGPPAAAERAIAPFRALAEPLADTVAPMPYASMFPAGDDEQRPIPRVETTFVEDVDLPASELIVERLRAATAPMAAVQLRVLGGAMARVPADATAYAHRDRALIANVVALRNPGDEPGPQHQWVEGLASALRPDRNGGAYVNFLGDDGEGRVREAYPGPTWDRLAATKARYDPTNLFRLNHNVPPAAPRSEPNRPVDALAAG